MRCPLVLEKKAGCADHSVTQELPKYDFSSSLHSWVGAGGATVPPWAGQTRVGPGNKGFRPTKSIKPWHLTRILESFELASINIEHYTFHVWNSFKEPGQGVLDLDYAPTSHTPERGETHPQFFKSWEKFSSNSVKTW